MSMKSGIINVYKEKGYTSFDVVARLRGILHIKKIGHTGTLDPEAEGVLPICIGKATKACSLLINTDKSYMTTMLLGKSTDTYDVFGNVVEEREVNTTPEEVEEALMSFVGEIDQIPPMYSAIKIGGKKLYELARKGEVVERKPRRVTIYNEETHSINLPRVKFSVDCSKGTYIRSLCNDIGEKLGCLACMEELTRTRAGDFRIEDALYIEEIEKLAKEGRINEILIPTDKMFQKYPKRYILDKYTKMCINGAKIASEHTVERKINKISSENDDITAPNSVNGASNDNLYRLYLSDDTFVGLYRRFRDTFIPEKMFYENI